MYSESVRNKVLTLVNKGQPVAKVAKRFNMSEVTIQNWKRKTGPKRTNNSKTTFLTAEQRKIVRDFERLTTKVIKFLEG